jgi:hypothetical protein
MSITFYYPAQNIQSQSNLYFEVQDPVSFVVLAIKFNRLEWMLTQAKVLLWLVLIRVTVWNLSLWSGPQFHRKISQNKIHHHRWAIAMTWRPSSSTSISKARFITARAISMKLGVRIPLGNMPRAFLGFCNLTSILWPPDGHSWKSDFCHFKVNGCS